MNQTNEFSSEVELERYRFRVETIERFFPPMDPRRFGGEPRTEIESRVYYVNGNVTQTYRDDEFFERYNGNTRERHSSLVEKVRRNPEAYLSMAGNLA